MFKNDKLSFKDEEDSESSVSLNHFWNILIVDDDEDIHSVTKLALASFVFNQKKCNFISAYSAREAQEILKTTPNIALALVDVVMETEDAGLTLVNYIRNELNNHLVRIILRTGQPGQAPEERVIHDYDINDYKSKSDLTTQKLYTSILTGLRSYRDLLALEKNRQGLRSVIDSTDSIEKISSIDLFLSALLEQLIALLHLDHYEDCQDIASFIALIKDNEFHKIAGYGIYKNITKEDFTKQTNKEIRPLVQEVLHTGEDLHLNNHSLLFKPSSLEYEGFILYMEVNNIIDDMDKDLIRLFLDKATTAYENAVLSQEIDETQKEMIFTLSEIAEHRSNETGKHVKRVALYSKILAQAYGLSALEIDTIYSASPMHDIGKMAIPDNILCKPGRLTDDEMVVMKTHAAIGHDMLKSSKRATLKMSAIIANEHHEKYDGSGYPRGLKGEEIHIFARIVALADVFDALGSRRSYKKPWEMDDILAFIKKEKAKHFDPKLIKLFFENIDAILAVHNKHKD